MKLFKRSFIMVSCILLLVMGFIIVNNFIRDARILKEPLGDIWRQAFGMKP